MPDGNECIRLPFGGYLTLQHHGLGTPKDATRIPYLGICEGFHEVGGFASARHERYGPILVIFWSKIS